jgi:hypothetical protein
LGDDRLKLFPDGIVRQGFRQNGRIRVAKPGKEGSERVKQGLHAGVEKSWSENPPWAIFGVL